MMVKFASVIVSEYIYKKQFVCEFYIIFLNKWLAITTINLTVLR